MFMLILVLVHLGVKASDSDEKFINDVKDILMDASSDQDMGDVSSLPVINIDPTPVYGAQNLELPSFMYRSEERKDSEGLDWYSCTYGFVQDTSPYFLRPGKHFAEDLGTQPKSGALRIETHEECVPSIWKVNQGGVEEFGTVKRESETNTFVVQWPAVVTPGDSLLIDFPSVRLNAEPCYYNLQSGIIQLFHLTQGVCASQVRITPGGNQIQNLPTVRYSAKVSSAKYCTYTFKTNDNMMPYWLRVGNHETQKSTANRVMIRIQTHVECQPRIFKYDTTWQPFGNVMVKKPGTGRQDTSYVVSWVTTSAAIVRLQLPPVVNGKICLYQLEGGIIAVDRQQQEECTAFYKF